MARIHWRAISAELRRLRENPEDVEAGARLFVAFGGEDDARAVARLRSSESGRRLLAERSDLLGALSDRERLRARRRDPRARIPAVRRARADLPRGAPGDDGSGAGRARR